ncbi:hypothetical protein L7F22_049243 [Adiantum nelumboides]|nr:hypothetical protein [Adiantum nelumboides]
MTYHQEWLKNLTYLSSPLEVSLGDDSTQLAQAYGDVEITLPEGRKVIVPQVYYVPGLRKNLISVSELTDQGLKMAFSRLGCHIHARAPRGQIFTITCPGQGKLYPLGNSSTSAYAFATIAKTAMQAETLKWHYRLGHISQRALYQMKNRQLALGLPKQLTSISLCEGCIIAPCSSTPASSHPLPAATSQADVPLGSSYSAGFPLISAAPTHPLPGCAPGSQAAHEQPSAIPSISAVISSPTAPKLPPVISTQFLAESPHLSPSNFKPRHQLIGPISSRKISQTVPILPCSQAVIPAAPSPSISTRFAPPLQTYHRRSVVINPQAAAIFDQSHTMARTPAHSCHSTRATPSSPSSSHNLHHLSRPTHIQAALSPPPSADLTPSNFTRPTFSEVESQTSDSATSPHATSSSAAPSPVFSPPSSSESSPIHPRVRLLEDIYQATCFHATLSEEAVPQEILAILEDNVGPSIEAALNSDEASAWIEAINAELAALQHCHTWTLVPRTSHHNIISCKWLLKRKLPPDGFVERHKVRLVHPASSHLSNNGWNRLFADPNIYVLHRPFGFAILGLFVDDIPVVASHPAIIDIVHDMLASNFPISDKGPMDFFLGITVFRYPHGRFIKLSQSHYIMQILRQFDMHSANGQPTPLALNARLAPELHPYTKADATALQDFKYNKLLGQLRYLITCTRLDLCYAGHILSRALQLPRRIHRQAALHCLRYLKHTMHYSLTFHRQDGPLAFTGYVDAD